jgi:DNA-binding CsgD family transcriptional regulator
MPAALELVGRDAELAEVAAFVAAIPAGPAVLILDGEPGIGKTAVWTSAVAAAREACQVLACQAARTETELSLAGLSDLLAPVIDTVLPALPLPLARALEIALLRAEPGTTPLGQRTLMTAFTEAVRSLSRQGPILVAIDDVQWLDRSTAAILAFALRRLDHEPVGVLASLRTSGEVGMAFDPLAEVAPDRVTRLTIGPLSTGALTRILRARVPPGVSWPTARRIHEASRGNPLYALELARSLAPGGYSIDEPLRVPPSLRQLVARRLASLPPAAADALLLAAASSEPRLTRLTTAMRGQSAESAVEPAVAAGIVSVDDDLIRFAHPLWSAATYSSASRSRRMAAHRRLAAVTSDQEEHARHLALATEGPDEGVAAALAAAASAAAARGANGSAAQLARLAARVSPADEPRLQRSIDAAHHLNQAGDPAAARRSLEDLAATTPGGRARARTLLALGQVRVYDLDAGPVLEILQEALDSAVGDSVLQAEIHLAMSWVCESDLAAGLAHAEAAESLLGGHDEPALLAVIITAQLMYENMCGRGMCRDLAERALALERIAPPASVSERPSFQVGSILRVHDDVDGARAWLHATLDQIAAEHAVESRFEVVSALMFTELFAGNWDAAERWARDAAESVELAGLEDQRAWAEALEAEVDAVRGRVSQARAKAGEALRLSVAAGSPFGMLRCLPVLGFVALSEDRPAEAVEHLSGADELCERIGLAEPGRFRFHADYAEALIAAGELNRAHEVLDRLEGRGRQLGRRWALATSARCRALLAMAHGDADGAAHALQSAFAWHDGLPIPFELGRTHLVAGEIHRRCKHKKLAAEQLRSALDIFDRLGAPLWSRRAGAELARVGLRTASPIDLTETERQVAELVSSGLTNREVAARMFVSLRTVESSLSRIYRKLGVRSRTELARAYPAGSAPAPQART